jgi:MSHA pilin protein MshA
MQQSQRHRPAARRVAAQAGFTLVELITVILILGVLAAVALPKFADLQGKARAAKVNAVAGSIKTAAALVKSVAMASSVSCSDASSSTATLEGTTIALNYCYPQALTSFSAGVLSAANVASTDGWTATGTSPLLLTLDDAATPASCSVSYTPAASASAPPVIATTVSGC